MTDTKPESLKVFGNHLPPDAPAALNVDAETLARLYEAGSIRIALLEKELRSANAELDDLRVLSRALGERAAAANEDKQALIEGRVKEAGGCFGIPRHWATAEEALTACRAQSVVKSSLTPPPTSPDND